MTQSCDSSTGLCEIAPNSGEAALRTAHRSVALIYVGDPMCSWCWGVSPAVQEIAVYCIGQQIGFSLLVGGLRPGGGDPWNESFRSFLRHEWQTIQQRTGQPFGFQLLERPSYNYDTEPACCAVVAARMMLQERPDATTALVSFFASIQRKFYTRGEDPRDFTFYREICEQHELDFARFEAEACSQDTLRATRQEYARVRQMGVRGFPSFLLQTQGGIRVVQAGYTNIQQLKAAIAAVTAPGG